MWIHHLLQESCFSFYIIQSALIHKISIINILANFCLVLYSCSVQHILRVILCKRYDTEVLYISIDTEVVVGRTLYNGQISFVS